MKILVTGKNGQLGQSIQKLILNYDHHEFILVGREEFDLSSSESIAKYFDTHSHFDVIINCAAYTAVDKAEEEPELADQINYQAVKQIAELSNFNNSKLIHISTDYVFDGKQDLPYQEDDKPNPLNVYGRTKLLGEIAIQEIMPKNAIIIRTSWVYSEFGNNFVKSMLRLGTERDEIQVVIDQIGSPTYATDLARAILDIISSKSFKTERFPSEIFNFSNAGEISWFDFSETIMRLSKISCIISPINSYQYPTKALRPINSTLSKEKITSKYSVKINSWERSLKACLNKILNPV